MINSITRLVLDYAIQFTNMNIKLDYFFQRSAQFFLSLIGIKVLNYFNVL